jgi:hypothetical protein
VASARLSAFRLLLVFHPSLSYRKSNIKGDLLWLSGNIKGELLWLRGKMVKNEVPRIVIK